jgi:hypothetical protein
VAVNEAWVRPVDERMDAACADRNASSARFGSAGIYDGQRPHDRFGGNDGAVRTRGARDLSSTVTARGRLRRTNRHSIRTTESVQLDDDPL